MNHSFMEAAAGVRCRRHWRSTGFGSGVAEDLDLIRSRWWATNHTKAGSPYVSIPLNTPG